MAAFRPNFPRGHRANISLPKCSWETAIYKKTPEVSASALSQKAFCILKKIRNYCAKPPRRPISLNTDGGFDLQNVRTARPLRKNVRKGEGFPNSKGDPTIQFNSQHAAVSPIMGETCGGVPEKPLTVLVNGTSGPVRRGVDAKLQSITSPPPKSSFYMWGTYGRIGSYLRDTDA